MDNHVLISWFCETSCSGFRYNAIGNQTPVARTKTVGGYLLY
jgi:hypothetical protein